MTAILPTIPPRAQLLARALASICAQTRAPERIIVVTDEHREGHGLTRTRGIEQAETDWLAFLDDDDEWYPHHLERLLATLGDYPDADVIFPWFDVIGGTDPFPHFEGVPWDWRAPHAFPITVLARRSALLEVGCFPGPPADEHVGADDYLTWEKMNAAGYRFVHHPERTWKWHHDSANTSGRPDRW